jgi:AraC-like DNA-binding protein
MGVAVPVVDVASARPHPALSPWIGKYLGYDMRGFEPGTHVGMPSPLLTFIISIGDPVDVAEMPGAVQGPGRYQAFVGGLHAGPATIVHDGNQAGVSVDLTPLGARALLGLPAGELASMVVDLDELLGPGATSLPDRLVEATTWRERFAVLDEVLTDAVGRREPTAPPPEVREAYRLLVESGGTVGVHEVAEEVGWSRRHLAERFREEVGLAPKATARVARFDVAKQLLIRGQGSASLADVAATAGYADQAHFTREFRELAGCTPTRWLAEELPSVQDPEPPDEGG